MACVLHLGRLSGGSALVPAVKEPRWMRVIRKATNLEQVGGLGRDNSIFSVGKTLKKSNFKSGWRG